MGKFLGRLKDNSSFNKIFDSSEHLERIINDNQEFFNIDFSDVGVVDFIKNPEYKLEDDEWFVIDYSQCSEAIGETVADYYSACESTAELASLNRQNVSKLSFFVFGKQNGEYWKVNLQSIKPSFLVTSRSYFKIDHHIEYGHNENVLDFKNSVDIHISQEEKKIYFKKFADLKKVDKKFIELYKEASHEEAESFIEEVNGNGLFNIDSGVKLESTNLKKLKFLLDDVDIAEFLKKEGKLKKYIKKYEIPLIKEDKKFLVRTNKDFTSLMKVFYENFYQGEITGKLRESNSNKVLG